VTSVARAVTFTGPGQVVLESFAIPSPSAGEARVRVEASALSAGTERLVLSGDLEPDEAVDASLAGLQTQLRFPLRYGYCAVGRIEALGPGVDPHWLGRRVFAFRPHQSHLVVPVAELVPLPDAVGSIEGTLLANVETAVSLMMDGAPLVGEVAGVVGLGIVGQLVSAMLAAVRLGPAVAVDPRDDRRALAVDGIECLARPRRGACDVVFEVSGTLAGLESALELARADGRVIVGSWYGAHPRALTLGSRVHRAHQTVRFSQVSRVSAGLASRFDKARRMNVATSWLERLPLSKFITHRFPAESAVLAYEALQDQPAGCLQIVLLWASVT
jgi:2-desacetyl-2-hydroxyethyl bacteriochlorophyllide A dehydrogenase